MPCDAVAVAGAQVAEEHLRQYLTPATITTPLTAYLGARFPHAQIASQTWGEEVVWTGSAGGQTQIIRVRAGQVTVTLDTGDQAAATALATELQQALTAIAATYWQRETYQLLAATYQVTESRPTADGSLIVRLHV
jgi:hypothetical protein